MRAVHSILRVIRLSGIALTRRIEVPPSSTRQEMREFARMEYERYRHVHDLVRSHIVMLTTSANVFTGPDTLPDIGKDKPSRSS